MPSRNQTWVGRVWPHSSILSLATACVLAPAYDSREIMFLKYLIQWSVSASREQDQTSQWVLDGGTQFFISVIGNVSILASY